MTTDSAPPTRYCSRCGTRLDATADYCPNCGAFWSPTALRDDIPSMIALLAASEDWRTQGLLDDASAERLRTHLETRLERLAPPRLVSPAPVEEGAPAAPPGAPVAWPIAAPRGPSWSAQHQADILLYLGAFLLVIAAVIFVTYQGEALPPVARVLLLVIYTAGFISAGLVVQRSRSVREAGRVFLALGALVTPLNFIPSTSNSSTTEACRAT